MDVSKYFWDLNEDALRETRHILRHPGHPKFVIQIVRVLSRCQNPKEIFSLVPKEEFVKAWPRIRWYWKKIARESDFRSWWETIYESLLEEYDIRQRKPKGEAPAVFLKIGATIREARAEKGLSQKELATKAGIKQPDISKIEEGKKNITLATLSCLCRALEIKEIKF